MTDEQIAELKKLAEAATDGERETCAKELLQLAAALRERKSECWTTVNDATFQ